MAFFIDWGDGKWHAISHISDHPFDNSLASQIGAVRSATPLAKCQTEKVGIVIHTMLFKQSLLEVTMHEIRNYSKCEDLF